MRQILFRGKTEDGKWVEGDFTKPCNIVFTTIGYDEVLKQDNVEIYNDEKVIPETVGQFTGLTDKNGKKIFEGDIVKCKHYWVNKDWQNSGNEKETFLRQKIKNTYGKMIINEESKLYVRYYYYRNYCIEYYALNGRYRIRNGSQFSYLTSNAIGNHDIEVIGNIHDNKELLESER